MNDVDELDRVWREGLATLAADLDPVADPHARVCTRVHHRRRSRIAVIAVVSIALIVAVVVAFAPGGSHSRVRVESPAPDVIAAVVQVTDAPGGRFAISFPGRATIGNPPEVQVPSGLIRLEIHSSVPGHHVVLDGFPDVVANFEHAGTIVREVRLVPGSYFLHCSVPGHTEAGERAMLDVGFSSPPPTSR